MGFLDKLCKQKEASIGPKGKIKNKTLDSSELKVLEEAGFHVTSSLPFFPSYKHGDFVTSMAKMHNSRNNSICKIRITDKPHVEEFFGSIQKFCFINGTPIALVALFEKINEDIVSVPDLQHHHTLLENDHKAARIFNLFAVKVKKLSLSRKLVAVTTNNIAEKAVHVPIKYSPYDIIVSIPGNIEHH